MNPPEESCQECGKVISRRARANVIGERIVCTKCWNRLDAKRRIVEYTRNAALAVIQAAPDHPDGMFEVPHGFYTKLRDVKGTNEDGSDRQGHIARCSMGDRLFLVKEWFGDSYTKIAAYTADANRIGYLSDERAEMVLLAVDRAEPVWVKITDLTGGSVRKPHRGVNVLVGYGPVKFVG